MGWQANFVLEVPRPWGQPFYVILPWWAGFHTWRAVTPYYYTSRSKLTFTIPMYIDDKLEAKILKTPRVFIHSGHIKYEEGAKFILREDVFNGESLEKNVFRLCKEYLRLEPDRLRNTIVIIDNYELHVFFNVRMSYTKVDLHTQQGNLFLYELFTIPVEIKPYYTEQYPDGEKPEYILEISKHKINGRLWPYNLYTGREYIGHLEIPHFRNIEIIPFIAEVGKVKLCHPEHNDISFTLKTNTAFVAVHYQVE